MPKLTLRTPPGFRFKHRGIGFLEGEVWLDAGTEFENLPRKEQDDVRSRINYWLDGGVHDKYFHGFPNDRAHHECYVFKYQALRLYGYLCKPKPNTDPGFQLCVLTEYASKNEWNTELTILDRAMKMLTNLEAIEAIAVTYPECSKGKRSWTN